MPLNDDNHQAARRVKDLEERVSDLEQQSRSTETPNILTTLYDEVGLGDSVEDVQTHHMETGRWGETGWAVSSWSSNEDIEPHLEVEEGETYTIESGDRETYREATIDGTLEADGVLEII
jgi:hypothetical protein